MNAESEFENYIHKKKIKLETIIRKVFQCELISHITSHSNIVYALLFDTSLPPVSRYSIL